VIEGVHIWRAALDAPGWPDAADLPADERERAAGFLRDEVRKRWVASRWALRRVLADYLGVAPAAVELEAEKTGKPRLKATSGLEFNLSHSEGLALVAVSDRPVGIDIEAIRPDRNMQAIAERVLPADDVAAVRTAPEERRAAVFYDAWVRHEARLKCLGTGLHGSTLQSSTSEVSDRKLVAVETLKVAPGYAAAVAGAGPEVGPITCRSLFA
jgi:4'-phosphopantetheinyl transferase